jgi:hypothetical protein
MKHTQAKLVWLVVIERNQLVEIINAIVEQNSTEIFLVLAISKESILEPSGLQVVAVWLPPFLLG